jgi:hypothetical protein
MQRANRLMSRAQLARRESWWMRPMRRKTLGADAWLALQQDNCCSEKLWRSGLLKKRL